MKVISTIALAVILLSNSGCEKNNTVALESCQGLCGCNTTAPVPCTRELRSLKLQARDQNGAPLALDQIVSTRGNGQQFKFKRESFVGIDTSASYAFWSDIQFENTRKSAETILVKGIKNNQTLFSRNFKVAHDCCHVILVEGETAVTVPAP